MNDISVWLTENWKYVVGGASILGYLGWDKGKAVLLNLLNKVKSLKSGPVSISPEQSSAEIEAADIAAISHLRNRAVEAKDEKLLAEIKSIAAKFFDIHTGVVKKDEV